MSFSDFILALLVLAAAALILWVYDINPYTNKLHIYTQQCDNMILDNTYCKGKWQEKVTDLYTIDQQAQQITHNTSHQTNPLVYAECDIQDRKNWSCFEKHANTDITVKDGKLQFDEKTDTRQISRLQWLQNRVLNYIN